MPNNTHPPDPNRNPEELKLEEEARIAEHKQAIAEAEYKAAKAKKDSEQLLEPEMFPGEQAQAAAQQAIAEANLVAIKSRRDIYKTPDIDAPTGKITTNDGVFVETRILIHETLSKTLRKFVKGFAQRLIEIDKRKEKDNQEKETDTPTGNKPNITLVIYSPSDMPALEWYSSAKAQLDEMENAYITANKRAEEILGKEFEPSVRVSKILADPLLIGNAATGILKTIAGVVTLFRTTTDFKNSDLATDEALIVASLVKAIYSEKKDWKVFNPSVFPIYTVKTSLASSPFVKKLSEIYSHNKSAEDLVDKIEKRIKRLEGRLAEEAEEANKRKNEESLAQHTSILTALKNLDSIYTQLETMLATAYSQTNIPALSLIMRAERLTVKLNESHVFTLKIIATSKGSNRITENLWRNASITHSAGTELSCLVFDSDGEIVFAESSYEYTPYTKPEAIGRDSSALK